jgi:hypothetical protein
MALAPGELVLEFVFDSFSAWRTSFLKLGGARPLHFAYERCRRAADGGRAHHRRAYVPRLRLSDSDRVRAAEDRLVGQIPSKELFAEAGRLSSLR